MVKAIGDWIDLNNEIMQVDDKGKNKLYKDKEALQSYQNYVKENTLQFDDEVERVRYLTKEGLYDSFFDSVPDTIIKELTEFAYSFNFEFQSFMACQKFYEGYVVLKHNKDKSFNFVENYEQHNVRVALYMFQDDYAKARAFVEELMTQRVQPATPTYTNAGKGNRGELSSCYLFNVDDTLDSMNFVENNTKNASRVGGGVAIDFTRIRPAGATVMGNPGASKGVVPYAKEIEQGLSRIDQGGNRPGAGAGYLNIFHMDIFKFLDAKKINASESLRLSTLSIGVIIPDKFMELVKSGEDFYTFDTYDIFLEYGKYMDEVDFNTEYDKLVSNENIRKEKHSAEDLVTNIAKTQLESGYPYVFFIDTANENHPLKQLGRVKMSNLCTEISQLQEISIIKPYSLHDDTIKRDVVCTLASLNLVNVVESGKLPSAVDLGMRSLSNVTAMMDLPQLPSVQKANDELRAVGIGAMNLHGLLAKNSVSYGSRNALDIVNSLFSAINYYSIKASMELAKETGEKFLGFEQSEYANGEYFTKYKAKSFLPITKKGQKVLSKTYIPSQSDWEQLEKDVKEFGLYNAYREAIAPTQSISYVQNSTSSIMPVPTAIEKRKYSDSETYYPMPYLDEKTHYFYEFESAYRLDNKKIINTSAVIQQHVDQAISTILYLPTTIPTNEVVSLFYYAWEKGLKSIYYVRSGKESAIECESCSV